MQDNRGTSHQPDSGGAARFERTNPELASLEDLKHQLRELERLFEQTGDALQAAATTLKDRKELPSNAPSRGLDALRDRIDSLRGQLHAVVRANGGQLVEESHRITSVEGLRRLVEQAEDTASTLTRTRDVLRRAVRLRREDGQPEPILTTCVGEIAYLTGELEANGLAPALVQALADGSHSLCALVTLVAPLDQISEEEKDALRQRVAEAYGSELARLASRGRLTLVPWTSEVPPPDETVGDQSDSEAAPEDGLPKITAGPETTAFTQAAPATEADRSPDRVAESPLGPPAPQRAEAREDELVRLVEDRTSQLRQAIDRLQRLSYTDALTHIANRRHFEEVLEVEWRRGLRAKTPVALMMIDIDRFKAYNDTFGHRAGDGCLTRVAATLDDLAQRAGDLVARYGGDEFAAILAGTDLSGATEVAERLRAAVEPLGIENGDGHPRTVITVSVGVAAGVPGEVLSPDALLGAADSALYEAKRAGRNCVRTALLVAGPAGSLAVE